MINSDLIRNHQEGRNRVRLDEADLVILRELAADARLPNNVLARKAGIAPSTCLARVRALKDSGVITGYHAELDLARLGLHVFAMISVRVNPQARHRMLELAAALRDLPETLGVFLLAGDRDFLVHVACAGPEELRDFINVRLADPAVASTQTSLVFEHLTPRAGAGR
ncbi:Lrp/AsnC family transcriptional regulator [Zafaria sp. Z1313]|uniref:Lrp/AsnC family transcriptional regulator n=1 Tax=unclassified Zafaria TaxID=2828765 RepID=UPI002E7779C4|nr:Lrp/AsnC family transcriptional regulator [Zafaria sp. J156]MEE1621059.1 Lrp/AsnC family transcriptional regulator [Zafaria sp. J156]